jgi:hypothetical protein
MCLDSFSKRHLLEEYIVTVSFTAAINLIGIQSKGSTFQIEGYVLDRRC